MIFREYLRKLNELAKANPGALELPMVYAIDDEGNRFYFVENDPTLGTYEVSTSEIHSVCVN